MTVEDLAKDVGIVTYVAGPWGNEYTVIDEVATARNIAAAIRAAVAEERERCAKIAEDLGLSLYNDRETVNALSCLGACRAVAKRIREAAV